MKNLDRVHFWAKTLPDGQPGISVRDHGLNAGCVAEELIAALLPAVRKLVPPGAAALTALHDVGKITNGFLAKCPLWLARDGSPKVSPGEVALSVTDHASVSVRYSCKRFSIPHRPGAGRLRRERTTAGRKEGTPGSTLLKLALNGRKQIAGKSWLDSSRYSALCRQRHQSRASRRIIPTSGFSRGLSRSRTGSLPMKPGFRRSMDYRRTRGGNRIHKRIERFLRNILANDVPLRPAETRKSTRLLRPPRYDSTRH